MLFTTDTGATRTVISDRIYNKLNPASIPVLKKTSCLTAACGTPLKEYGKGTFSIQLGPVNLQKELIVAEIEDDGLLGIDILQNDDAGPADILLSKGVTQLKGKDIPCIQVGLDDVIRKVTVADHFVIPGQSEAVVDVYVEREEADDLLNRTEFLIEPTNNFREKYPLQMAATLVDLNNAVTSKVRILNPFPTAVSLRQDAVIGAAELVDPDHKIISQAEHNSEEDNYVSIKRIQFEDKNMSLSSSIRQLEEDDISLPKHLEGLYERSSSGKSPSEAKALAKLLVKYQDTFSKGEWDIGMTNLTEHVIKTGDAAPIKQAPRRVPLAYAGEEKKAIDDLLEKGVIRKSTSPWASPIVLVRKKSGAIRPCVDYRRVNALVKPDGFPLPRIQDCLDAVSGSSLFSCFDLTSGYFQIPLKEEDIPKSAFCCKYGHFENDPDALWFEWICKYLPTNYGTGSSGLTVGDLLNLHR